MEHPSLEWVIVDGEPRHVSGFATLPPNRRPPAACPQCARRVTLKLGAVRRHHAAHDPGHLCAATHPETALHLNTKFALAAALARAAGPDATLTVVRHCAGVLGAPEACRQTLSRQWLRGWDDVRVEHRAASAARPDIVLMRNGAVAGAIEILVSHAVSADKAAALAALGVEWIEVSADERLATPGGWTSCAPLDVLRASDEPEWRCDEHRSLHAAALVERDRARAAERESTRHARVLVAARVVDVYHARGVRERFIYRVTELSTDGVPHTLRLQRGGVEVATVSLAPTGGTRRDVWPHLRLAFEADLTRLLRDDRSFTDSPMRWARGDAAENIVDEALADRVGRDPTPLATRFPRRWFYAAAAERWFLPPDTRDVRWDRPPGDAFAAHPASSRARTAVRERPAPEGSWTTPVFARRPVAALFRAGVRSIAPSAQDASMVVVHLSSSAADARRAIVVIERETPAAAIASLASALGDEDVDAVWMSHPSDWSPALAPLAWVPAGRDSRGQVCVVVDGLGIFRADQFARALSAGDERLAAGAIRRRMIARVERMSAG